MQTVNFNCPHCGNLMAVGMNLLGRNVRCPHCKAVVQAPTAPGEPMSSPALVRTPVKPPEPAPPPPPQPQFAPPPSAPLPQFNLPPKESEAPESIFGEVHDEDVFGSEPPKPTMPKASPPPPVIAPTIEIQSPDPMPAPAALYEPPAPTYPEVAPAYAPPPMSVGEFDPTGPTMAMPPPELRMDDTETLDAPEPSTASRPSTSTRERRTQRPPSTEDAKGGGNAFAVILLAYGLLMTVAAGVFGYLSFVKSNEPEHPFKAIPDVFGEYEKANRKQTSYKWMPDARAEVPDDLRVKIGSELVLGDLSVTPVEVKKELITAVEQFVSGDDRVRPVGPKTLVLSLKVKNTSPDVTFHPFDPAFVRRLEAKTDERAGPLTALQVNRKMYYGLFPWPVSGNTKKEFVQGQESNEKPLKPGEENTIFITVAPKQDVVGDLTNVPNDQSLLWRVQLRRGMVKYKDEAGKEGEFSATTVIGVTFTKKQIQ